MNPYRYIDNLSGLKELTSALESVQQAAVDTEADSLHHYYEKVCLIQITCRGGNFILDPFAKLDFSRFFEVLSEKNLILHGADYDLRMLFACFNFQPKKPVFDTMIASQILGIREFGFAALVDKFFQVKLNKQGQKSDWSRRPLSPSQLQYAADDTHYLEPLGEKLKEELERLERSDWHRESCARMVEGTTETRTPKEEPWRVKGSGTIRDRREFAFLRELWTWREKEAQTADYPVFMVMRNEDLLDLVKTVSSLEFKIESLETVKLPRSCKGERFAALKSAVQKSLDLPRSEWPGFPRHKRMPVLYFKQEEFEALRNEGLRIANELGIEASVLASRSVLEETARKRPRTREEALSCGFLRWQFSLLERALFQVFK